MDRRLFLKGMGLTGAGLALSSAFPFNAFAQMAPQDFFILVHVEHGWDVSLSTDPWTREKRPTDSDYFLEYLQSDLIPFGNSFVGPAMAPLKEYFSRMSVINGIFMNSSDNGHPGLARYAQTGNGQGSLAALPLEIEGRLFTSPFGAISNVGLYSANRVGSIWSTKSIIKSTELTVVDSLAAPEFQTDIERARVALMSNRDKIDIFNKILAKYLEAKIEMKDHHALAAAFGAGLSRSGMIRLSDFNLDSHDSHEKKHLNALTSTMGSIAEICKTLQSQPAPDESGKSLLDVTTILVVSEFGRTPALNNSKGKDHNPQANSALLMGPRVNNSKIGATQLIDRRSSAMQTPYLAGLPLSLQTQEISSTRENSFIVRPENVFATTLRALGMDPHQVSSSIGKSEILKLALKR